MTHFHTASDDRPTVVVVGAGISGLCAAWAARRAGARVVVLEARGRSGGVITTVRSGEYLAELGPTSLMETPAVAALVDGLGLGAERRPTSPAARRRYVLRDGRPVPVPTSPRGLLGTPLLSLGGKLRALAEPLVPRRAPHADEESLADFVRRRFGAEVLDWLVDPFVSGVYAGDPARLGARHALRPVGDLEREHGSVLVGAVRAARAARRAGRSRPAMISFAGGLRSLPDALAGALGTAVRLGARVRGVTARGDRWTVRYEDDGGAREECADAVVVATPAHSLPALPDAVGDRLAPARDVPHAAVATVALGFRRVDVGHPLDGFGVLAPSRERCGVLGVLFNSSLFDGRAPDGHVLVTCFVGGARAPAAALEDHDALVRRALAAIEAPLGVRGAPTLAHSASWAAAIPQYGPRHATVTDAADAAEAMAPGLLFAGSWRHGVSIGDCVASGLEAGARAAARAGTGRRDPASIAEPSPCVA